MRSKSWEASNLSRLLPRPHSLTREESIKFPHDALIPKPQLSRTTSEQNNSPRHKLWTENFEIVKVVKDIWYRISKIINTYLNHSCGIDNQTTTLCIYTYIYIYTYMNDFTCRNRIYIYIDMNDVYIYMSNSIHTYVNIHKYIHTFMHAYIHTYFPLHSIPFRYVPFHSIPLHYIHTCKDIYIYIYTYIYIYL